MVMERDGDTSKRKGETQKQQDQEAKRLKCTIGPDAQHQQQEETDWLTSTIKPHDFSCTGCTLPLRPPIFQCSAGHYKLWCSSCHDNQPKCSVCDGSPSLERSYGMEHAVRSIFVNCCNADHGCTSKIAYSWKERHEKYCPHAPCSCPYDSSCDFVGRAAELLEHLTGHHKCPCTEFKYWIPIDLRVKPGLHVLHCKDDGQLTHVRTQTVEQPCGYAVYIICIPSYDVVEMETAMGCSVSFSCSGQFGTSTKDIIRICVTDRHWAPTPRDYLCFVPKVSDGPEEVVLSINISCADAAADEDDSDDSSYYIHSDDSEVSCYYIDSDDSEDS
ncbi:hypothetical protein PR202_gb26585 [Eleusine coracana subsp. coracana]|uniref:SIAH-type domain-containing protein n=1 Tax=Eleusine coracana subsp. coracana TaxID=191504 RepID=A0AAV5FS89_ELECO|nr:hypothetical protein QOZ80_1BG0056720 [Eleusine coracana subsp. coracana]GJN37611.1 hypothetical protein PR202_gb26585 [Eleusine coracana subsp. coracana]